MPTRKQEALDNNLRVSTSPAPLDEQQQQSPAPSPTNSSLDMPSPTDQTLTERLKQIDDLKQFFATATHSWDPAVQMQRFPLPTGDDVSCVLWANHFYITGTDIVRSLVFRFHAFGRPVTNMKKFEEGIFSDLRNLKAGTDARLEEPKSDMLNMLFKHNCIRTQKKQKVFFWYAVPHDRLFYDALERDLKREKMGFTPASKAVAKPATSVTLDSIQELFDCFQKQTALATFGNDQSLNAGHRGGTGSPDSLRQRVSRSPSKMPPWVQPRSIGVPIPERPKPTNGKRSHTQQALTMHAATARSRTRARAASAASTSSVASSLSRGIQKPGNTTEAIVQRKQHFAKNSLDHSKSVDAAAYKRTKMIFGALSLLDGSPSYKQRRRRAASTVSASASAASKKAIPEAGNKTTPPTQTTNEPEKTPNHGASVSAGASRLAKAAEAAGWRWSHDDDSHKHGPQSNATPVNWLDTCATSNKPFACAHPSCHLTSPSSTLLEHRMSDHGDGRSWQCDFCSKQFTDTNTLRQHHKAHTMFQDATMATNTATVSMQTVLCHENLSHEFPAKSLGDEYDFACQPWTTTQMGDSRRSSLSPLLDLEVEMQDASIIPADQVTMDHCLDVKTMPPCLYPTQSTSGTPLCLTSSAESAFTHPFDPNSVSIRQQQHSRTSSLCEDDTSMSSSTSSPSSALNYMQQSFWSADAAMYNRVVDACMMGDPSACCWETNQHPSLHLSQSTSYAQHQEDPMLYQPSDMSIHTSQSTIQVNEGHPLHDPAATYLVNDQDTFAPFASTTNVSMPPY